MNDPIGLVVKLFREFPNLSDDQVLARLFEQGMNEDLAKRLLTFIPMVYVRILLGNTPVRFPDSYEIEIQGESRRELHRFSDEPSWPIIYAFARAEIARGLSSKELLDIAGRSAELDAINQALNAGCQLENAQLGNAVVKWS